MPWGRTALVSTKPCDGKSRRLILSANSAARTGSYIVSASCIKGVGDTHVLLHLVYPAGLVGVKPCQLRIGAVQGDLSAAPEGPLGPAAARISTVILQKQQLHTSSHSLWTLGSWLKVSIERSDGWIILIYCSRCTSWARCCYVSTWSMFDGDINIRPATP
jgi:hypothetical protein